MAGLTAILALSILSLSITTKTMRFDHPAGAVSVLVRGDSRVEFQTLSGGRLQCRAESGCTAVKHLETRGELIDLFGGDRFLDKDVQGEGLKGSLKVETALLRLPLGIPQTTWSVTGAGVPTGCMHRYLLWDQRLLFIVRCRNPDGPWSSGADVQVLEPQRD